MENIYHDYWQQELAYQFLAEGKCRKRAYICSPYSADKQDEILQNMYAARAYMYYAMGLIMWRCFHPSGRKRIPASMHSMSFYEKKSTRRMSLSRKLYEECVNSDAETK